MTGWKERERERKWASELKNKVGPSSPELKKKADPSTVTL